MLPPPPPRTPPHSTSPPYLARRAHAIYLHPAPGGYHSGPLSAHIFVYGHWSSKLRTRPNHHMRAVGSNVEVLVDAFIPKRPPHTTTRRCRRRATASDGKDREIEEAGRGAEVSVSARALVFVHRPRRTLLCVNCRDEGHVAQSISASGYGKESRSSRALCDVPN